MERLSAASYGRYAFAPLKLQMYLKRGGDLPYGRFQKVLREIDNLSIYICFFSDYKIKLCMGCSWGVAMIIFSEYGEVEVVRELDPEEEEFHMNNDYKDFII